MNAIGSARAQAHQPATTPATHARLDRPAATTLARRDFLSACGGAAICATLAGCASLMVRPVAADQGKVTLLLADFPELRATNGAASILPPGFADPVLVLRVPGGFAAVSPICTHRGCTVEVAGDRLECPCHGSTYDRTGALLGGPAERPLARFGVTTSTDRVVIDLGPAR